ncbi:MAG TPA: DUF4251 domain-containing protein [Puia sp.]|nr:DUF4251 domain-containing protein [Puia sp.]
MKIYRLLLPFLMIMYLTSSAQSNADQTKQASYQKLKRGIDAKQFHFLATSATGSRGRTVQLTGGYFVFLGGDSLTVSLPFYGTETQTSHYGASKEDAGINFHTHKFSYKADTTKKGGWDITIKPDGQSSASRIYFSISSTGSCRTSVSSSGRSNMTFYGNVLSNFKD